MASFFERLSGRNTVYQRPVRRFEEPAPERKAKPERSSISFENLSLQIKNSFDEADEKNAKLIEALEDKLPKAVADSLLSELSSNNEALLGKIEETLANQKKDTQDIIHTENVKVYRNVQAVVVEESGKQSAKTDALKSFTAKKMDVAITFSILAFIASLLTLAFNVLSWMGIL